MVRSPMDTKTVQSWLAHIKTEAGQNDFLQNGLEDAINIASRVGVEQLSEADILLIRLLRNSVPLGAGAVSAILRGGVVGALVRALQPRTSWQDDPGNRQCSSATAGADGAVATAFLAACAQLLANLANSGSAGSSEVWTHCFPSTFLTLTSNPSAQVHQPATLALYACCRQDMRRSRQLCSAPQPNRPTPPHHQHQQPAAADAGRVGDTGDTATGTDPRDTQPPTGSQASLGETHTSCCGGDGGGGGGGSADAGTAVRRIWEALLARLLVSEQQQQQERDRDGGGAGGPDWTALLCGCVGLRQGLLEPLLALLSATPDAADSDESEPDAVAVPVTVSRWGGALTTAATGAAAGRFGRLWPALLHVMAHELFELGGGGNVDVGEQQEEQKKQEKQEKQEQEGGCSAGVGDGGKESVRASGGAAAAAGGGGSSAEVGGGAASLTGGTWSQRVDEVDGAGTCPEPSAAAAAGSLLPAELPPTAWPVAAALRTVAAVADRAARRVAAAGEQAGSGAAGRAGGREGAELAAAVLEAALEVLKSITQREDGGRAIAGGIDLAEWLLLYSGGGKVAGSSSSSIGSGNNGDSVLHLVLGMLAALQPAANARQDLRRRAGGAAGTAGDSSNSRPTLAPPPASDNISGGEAAAASAPPPDRPVVELPVTLQVLAAHYPRHAAYMGYRGDLVSVLANGAFRRPRVVSELLAAGGLELLLAQTNLDEHSPLAREWALWGVRNMCEGNEEVQARIAGLQLQTTVETPELQKLGLRIELDKNSGKLKVAKTPEAEALLQEQHGGA